VPQGRGDRDVVPGRQDGQAVRVAARGHHARAGGQGQPVAIVPAQRAGNRPVGDAAGGIDPAQAVHHVRGQGGRLPGRGRQGQGPGCAGPAARPVAGRGAPGDDGRDERAGHGRLPEGKARPDGAMRAARRAARVFKRVSVLGDISPFWVSEGGLDPLSWWYIPESGIYHQSKLTRQGPSGRAFRGRAAAAPPDRMTNPSA
jgi:hypothetical protein